MSVTVEQKSLLPGDLANAFPSPFQSLVAYLRTRTGRDLTKTIQAEIPGGVPYDNRKDAGKGLYPGRTFAVNPVGGGLIFRPA